jgi:hypothetical protein
MRGHERTTHGASFESPLGNIDRLRVKPASCGIVMASVASSLRADSSRGKNKIGNISMMTAPEACRSETQWVFRIFSVARLTHALFVRRPAPRLLPPYLE